MGDSRGRWEGDTLVVETTNFKEKGGNGPSRLFTATARMTERLTRTDAHTIRYEATVNDPKTWIQPWTAVIRSNRTRAISSSSSPVTREITGACDRCWEVRAWRRNELSRPGRERPHEQRRAGSLRPFVSGGSEDTPLRIRLTSCSPKAKSSSVSRGSERRRWRLRSSTENRRALQPRRGYAFPHSSARRSWRALSIEDDWVSDCVPMPPMNPLPSRF